MHVGAIRVTETDGITLENVQAGNGLITVDGRRRDHGRERDIADGIARDNNISLTANGIFMAGTVERESRAM